MRDFLENETDSESPKKMKQWQLNIILTVLGLAIVGIIFMLAPETRIAAIVVWKGIVILAKSIWFLILAALVIFGPGVIMWFARWGVDSLDEQVDRGDDINGWVHFLICVTLSIALAVVWMVWGVRFVVDLPSWIKTIYENNGWYVGLIENLPWGWGISALVFSVIGYILGSSENREFFS